MDSKDINKTNEASLDPRKQWVKFVVATVLYLLFLYWVGSWWGLVVIPFIYDAYISKKIPWTWWKKSKNKTFVWIMGWVDAIVFALVAVYFVNQFFFQNYVIPSSSLEKSLLVGDYLAVSKVSYGPRIPQTPLTMPLTQHTLPLLNCKSYLEWPHWEYRRVKGLGNVQLNDIVVFNYPSGDTVALNMQNADYYTLAYGYGAQLNPDKPVLDSLDILQQRAYYAKNYAYGSRYIKQNPQQFGEVVARPTDRRENYVKRCVGLPGQTLQIKDRIIYLDGVPNKEPDNVQYNYLVATRRPIPQALSRQLGISNEDLQNHNADRSLYVLPLTEAAKKGLLAQKNVVSNITPYPDEQLGDLYPLNMHKDWTCNNYGPVWIPKKGESIKLTLENLPIYERPIAIYEGNKLEVTSDGRILINGVETDTYTFQMDYYWMQGDNRHNSADSRYWGFVPEDHIVGKPLFIWMSLDKDRSLFDGGIRWKRLFKWVDDIK
ncbi:MAG: S26 family signal peptidase [Bacteroidaceae bacterium]|nr:S26 family signal peptidase [Bacteroidaceae bacterium]